jgi:hypothetical protein
MVYGVERSSRISELIGSMAEKDSSQYYSVIRSPKGGWIRTRTNIETQHFLETLSVITAAEYPSHVVHEGDGVCRNAVKM